MSSIMDLADDHGSLPALPPSPKVDQSLLICITAPGRAPKKAGGGKDQGGPYKRKPKGKS